MPTFVVRVWIPDRPGAFGAVASRIGAVRGDLIGIDILERGGGMAIDELVVDLPSADVVRLMVVEIAQVDGVTVEDVRPLDGGELRDPRVDALETAAVLVACRTGAELFDVLVREAVRDFSAAWAAVVDLDVPIVLAAAGEPPALPWLGAFLAGSRSSVLVADGRCGPEDVAWAAMPDAQLALVLGREGRPFRARERRQVTALARIADARCLDLAERPSHCVHPTAS